MSDDVVIVTHAAAPDGVRDDHLLATQLSACGASVLHAVWNDPAVDWSSSSLAVVRSVWDYHLHRGEWAAWLSRVQRETELVNPAGLIRWNGQKDYLFDLEERGVPVVPSMALYAGSDLASACDARGWTDVVIKPVVGASAFGTRRFRGPQIGLEGRDHLARLLQRGPALLQPFQTRVLDRRERSLVFLGGRFSHAMTKPPFHAGLDENALMPHAAEDAELQLAANAMEALDESPIFARVDVVPSQGGPVLMELALIEPELSLHLRRDAARDLANLLIHR